MRYPQSSIVLSCIIFILSLIKCYMCVVNEHDKDSILNYHKEVRDYVGVPPLKWSKKLEHMAQQMATNCSSEVKGPYGRNVLPGYLANTWPSAVFSWAGEFSYYNHARKICGGQSKTSCDEYTQMIWRDTISVGCGDSTCFERPLKYFVCVYYPRGNIPGRTPY
ncbi:hypothetical protein RND81_04G220600 [Saponaria officinalis]|uniref:SCP domain-containing protein n=1 Tax=Saponaria officinalis TaxID=3572 RepID=A0AAW1LRC4_SAPOF